MAKILVVLDTSGSMGIFPDDQVLFTELGRRGGGTDISLLEELAKDAERVFFVTDGLHGSIRATNVVVCAGKL